MRMMGCFVCTAVLLVCGLCRAEDKITEKFQIWLSPKKVAADPPVVEAKILVKDATVTPEIIPAVYKVLPDGTTEMVSPEKQIRRPVPAIYETREYMLELDADTAKRLKELAEKGAIVDITGERAPKTSKFKVTAIDELRVKP